MALVRTLSKGLRKTPRQGGNPGDVDGPTVTISGYPTDPTDDPTPTFTFTANEPNCTFEYKVNAGSYAACTSPLTLGAQADGTYTMYIRATDSQGNVGTAATYSWDLVTAYAGTLPATVGTLNGWSLASPWTVLYNLHSATLGPAACAKATGSVGNNLIKLGSSSDSAKTAAGQSGYADQTGFTVNSSQDFLYANSTTEWSQSTTTPTCYLVTLKFESTPTSGYTVLGGQTGTAGGGWFIACHETSGIRAFIGDGTTGFTATSYVGGASFYDGEYHTILLVIDDANGKAKLYSEFANTESTGLTIGGGASFCTVGPSGAGDAWYAPTTYLVVARGEHPLLYTNAQSLFDEYEDARLNNVNQTAIDSLPKSLADLNDASGLTFTDGWNLESTGSNSALTGASTAAISPFTGTVPAGGTGTAPTAAAAPQVRTSFTSQAAVLMDSSKDNLGAGGGLPTNDFTMLLVWYTPASYTSGTGVAGRVGYTAGNRGWRVRLSTANTLLETYSSYGTSVSATLGVDMRGGNVWRTNVIRVAPQGSYSRLVSTASNTSTISAQNSVSTVGVIGTAPSEVGQLGCEAYGPQLNSKYVMCAWLNSQVSDANIEAAINSFRWRYGI